MVMKPCWGAQAPLGRLFWEHREGFLWVLQQLVALHFEELYSKNPGGGFSMGDRPLRSPTDALLLQTIPRHVHRNLLHVSRTATFANLNTRMVENTAMMFQALLEYGAQSHSTNSSCEM